MSEDAMWKAFHVIEDEVVKNIVKVFVTDKAERRRFESWCAVLANHGIGATEAIEIMKELADIDVK